MRTKVFLTPGGGRVKGGIWHVLLVWRRTRKRCSFTKALAHIETQPHKPTISSRIKRGVDAMAKSTTKSKRTGLMATAVAHLHVVVELIQWRWCGECVCGGVVRRWLRNARLCSR